MEKNIELSEALDSLMDNAIRRRNDAMKQLEVHRVGLGARVKEVADRIVDVEFREVTPVGARATMLIAADAKVDDHAKSAKHDGDAE